MKKCDGIRWLQLEGPVPLEVKQIPVASAAGVSGPVYPSSAPKKRDWDKIEVEIKKEESEEKCSSGGRLSFQTISYFSGSSNDSNEYLTGVPLSTSKQSSTCNKKLEVK